MIVQSFYNLVWATLTATTHATMGNYISGLKVTNEEKGEFVHKHNICGSDVYFNFVTNGSVKGDCGGVKITDDLWCPARFIREMARLIDHYEVLHGVAKSEPTNSKEEPNKSAIELKIEKLDAKIKALKLELKEADN